MNDHTPTPDSEGRGPSARLTNILVPTDFSAGADRAFACALDLARQHGATVHLLHVIGPLEGDAYSPLRFSPEAYARHETPEKIVYDLLQERLRTHDAEGVAVEVGARHSSAVVPLLVHYAEAEGIDLIVMGTHGRHGLQRFFTGSVAERTVRQAPCSVLIVHAAPDAAADEKPPPLSVQRILVPVDFSEHTDALLRAAGELAVAYDAQIDLLHVIEPLPFVGTLSGVMTANDLVPNLKGLVQRKLKDLQAGLGERPVQVKVHVEEGHAAAHIVDFAARCGTDLIVIASQGRSGVERFLIGSVAERVVRAAACPVLIVKALAVEETAQVEQAPAELVEDSR